MAKLQTSLCALMPIVWLGCILGCGENNAEPLCEPSDLTVSLIDQRAWTYQDTAEGDPLAGHRPDPIACPSYAYEVEGGIFEVNTGACNYLSATQPSLYAVQSCDSVHATISHFDLYSPQPTQGHVSVLIDGTAIIDEVVQIPSAANVIHVRAQAGRAYAAGVPIVFHLHNHGTNQWQIIDVAISGN